MFHLGWQEDAEHPCEDPVLGRQSYHGASNAMADESEDGEDDPEITSVRLELLRMALGDLSGFIKAVEERSEEGRQRRT